MPGRTLCAVIPYAYKGVVDFVVGRLALDAVVVAHGADQAVHIIFVEIPAVCSFLKHFEHEVGLGEFHGMVLFLG